MSNINHRTIVGAVLFSTAVLIIFFTTGKALYYTPDSSEAAYMASSTAFVSAETMVTATMENSEASLPNTLVIPKLGIEADVQHLGVTESGLMAAPKNFTDVSWYKYGAVPGEQGSAVMAGHEDNALSLAGVFKHLEDLEAGDSVYVDNEDGTRLHFRVVKKEVHPYNLTGESLNDIFTRSDGKYLNLITCTGDWLPEARTNDKRLVVYTELVEG